MATKRSASRTKSAARKRPRKQAAAPGRRSSRKSTASKSAKRPAKKSAGKKSSKKKTKSSGPGAGGDGAGPSRQLVNRARRIYRKLEKTYPKAECALKHNNAYELLVATILSAQCTDERVNKTTPELFRKYPTPKHLAESKQEDVERIIRSCGFYRNKTKSIRAAAQGIVEKFDGEVPDTMEGLTSLQGVARKTANVILETAYGINAGVVVDTHVKRLANRMGLTERTDPKKIEPELMALFPRSQWGKLAHMLIWHGRRICTARNPDCEHCPVRDDCPKIGVADRS